MGPSKTAPPKDLLNDFGLSIPGTSIRTMPFDQSVFIGVSMAVARKFESILLEIVVSDMPTRPANGYLVR